MIRTVDIPTFAAAYADGATVIDVREPDEYAAGHVPGARLIPMGEIHQQLDSIPASGDVYLICRSGNRSGQVAEALAPHGFDFINVLGGTMEWIARGHEVNEGDQP